MLKKYINIKFNLMTNFPLSTKSKNSRMGKGKGSLYSWSVRLPLGYTLIELQNLNSYNQRLVINSIKKLTNINLVLLQKPKNNLLYL